MMASAALEFLPVTGLPEVDAGHDLGMLLGDALAPLGVARGDIIAVAQKIVSKAEGRRVALSTVEPDAEARTLAERADKDPRMMALLLAETREVVRVRPGVVIVEDRRGFVMANAGIDRSNVGGDDAALLLPVNPDRSAQVLRIALEARFGAPLGVLVIDSFGRAWRRGVVGTAIGASGIEALVDARGRPDRFGRPMEATDIGVADALAAAAGLVMGEADEGVPCVLIRGWRPTPAREGLGGLLRPAEEDMFR